MTAVIVTVIFFVLALGPGLSKQHKQPGSTDGLGFATQGQMELRVSPDDAKALAKLMQAAGLRCTRLTEFSAAELTVPDACLMFGLGSGADAFDRLAEQSAPGRIVTTANR